MPPLPWLAGVSDSLGVAVGAGDEILRVLVPVPLPMALPAPVVGPARDNVPLPSIARILSLTEEDVDLTPGVPVMEPPRREDALGERLVVGALGAVGTLGVLAPGCEPVRVRGCAAGLGLDDFRPVFETEAAAEAEVELTVPVGGVGIGDGEGDKLGRLERGVADRNGTVFFSSFSFSSFSDVEDSLVLDEVRGLVTKRELVEEGRDVREVRDLVGSAAGAGGLVWAMAGFVIEGLDFVLCEAVVVIAAGAFAFPLSFFLSSFSDSSGGSTSSKASSNISSSSLNPFATPASFSNA